MKMKTSRFGEYEYQLDDVLTFSKGLPGFREHHRFVLIKVEGSPFMYLQAVEDGELAFIVVSPFEFFAEYEFNLNELIKLELNIQSEKDLVILNVISVKEDLESATINLAAPIVVNMNNRRGLQYILSDSNYSIRQPLFSPLIEGRV